MPRDQSERKQGPQAICDRSKAIDCCDESGASDSLDDVGAQVPPSPPVERAEQTPECGSCPGAHGCTNDSNSRATESTKDVLVRASADLMAELEAFEHAEARRLGLERSVLQWHDPEPQTFAQEDRAHTTVLFGGLTEIHDTLLEAALTFLGYKAKALPGPDNEALRVGKEFCSRGECNPVYFMVGNLVRYLSHLRDEGRESIEDIVQNHILITASACGPCRFGTYATEYRKALRDAGFEGFRIIPIDFQSSPEGMKQSSGLELDRRFTVTVLKCLMAADVISALGYRIRPYEVKCGATDSAQLQCLAILKKAIIRRSSMVMALRRCRKMFAEIQVNRLQPKPKVALIGEFWAMTTEGAGNYMLQRFLEAEGAECTVQPVATYLLYVLWCRSNDLTEQIRLRRRDDEPHPENHVTLLVRRLAVNSGLRVLRAVFHTFARAAGLERYRLSDMDELARISHEFYPVQLRGGEGHMEVGKLIEGATGKKTHLTVSVKPFGCMPSSGVSDGIQTLVTTRYPEANFLAIETTGDAAVSAYSRVQMALFKARAKAQEEFDEALRVTGLSLEKASRAITRSRRLRSATHYPRHRKAGTSANAVYELASTRAPSYIFNRRAEMAVLWKTMRLIWPSCL